MAGKIFLLYLLLVFARFMLAITTEDKMFFYDLGSLQIQRRRCAVTEETRSSQWIWWKLLIDCRFFPVKGSELYLQLLGGLLEDSSKSRTSRKDGYGVNPDTGSSLWFGGCLAGFQGADGASSVLLFVCELLAALQSEGSVGLVKMAVLPWQKTGRIAAAWERRLLNYTVEIILGACCMN